MTETSLYIENSRCYLLNKFPFIDEAILMEIFTEHKTNLTSACHCLRTGLKNPFSFTWKDKPIKRCLVARNPTHTVQIDETFLEEKKLIEKSEEEERGKRDHLIRSKMTFKKQEYKGAHIQECPICCVKFLADDMNICSFGHNVCRNCLKDFLQNGMKNFEPKVMCFVVPGCPGVYSDKEMRKTMNTIELDAFYQKLIQFELGRAKLNGLFACPDCSYQFLVSKETSSANCSQCRKSWCLFCYKLSHGKEICPRIKEEEGKIALARYVADILDKKFTRRCATCKKPCIKDGGCDFVKCTCGGALCWGCGIPLTPHNHGGNHLSVCRGFPETYEQVEARATAEFKQAHPEFFMI